ncbi:hypothetical protein RDI58_004839 [Solanum bulbocastanum]|uniref:AAA-type ATPase N-terminal domain-containing protein n=1 Tax=Solanum bulbocastanum TaxID=147425 RepID=A0AAN8U791_SOLBU
MANYSKPHICQCLSRLSTARRSSTVMIIGERRKISMKFVGGDLGLAHGLIQLGLKLSDVVAISALNSKAYVAIERYLSKNSSIQAKRLKASVVKYGQSLVLSMDDHEEVTDDYEGAKVWWISSLKEANRPTIA